MPVRRKSFRMMGTIIDVQIESHYENDYMQWVEDELIRYNNLFSANQQDSKLMEINNQAGISKVHVDEELYKLIKLGINYSLEEHSALNICIGPLVQLWRIGFDDAKTPSHKDIENALLLSNPKAVELDDDTKSVYLKHRGMKLDLGCLAKGSIADQIIKYLKEQGVSSALINLGGNILVHGDAPGREDGMWRVGISDPNTTTKQDIGVLKIRNQSVVTSGINERRHQEYHHIFDRKTGYPIESDVASLTIIADSSLICEVYTTLLFGDDAADIITKVKDIPMIECIVVKKDGTVLSSKERLFI